MLTNLKIPTVEISQHQQEFRLTLLNTKKSAVLGLILLLFPFLFLSGVILKHYLQIDFGVLTSVYEWIGSQDQQFGDASFLNWMIRLLLLFGPLLAAALNLIAITHFRYEKINREAVFVLKLKWLNLIVLAVCILFFSVFFSYFILENLH